MNWGELQLEVQLAEGDPCTQRSRARHEARRSALGLRLVPSSDVGP